ncbi:MAG: D-sedoheptulose 7-phosphate isomerase [bacterium]
MDVDRIQASVVESARVLNALAATAPAVREAGLALARAVTGGGKILLCGNGGSAADAQHFATELTVRYLADRPAIPAIALTTDTSVLTAASNDLGFERVFARQVEALGRPGDALVAISTSGNSANVLAAAREARERGLVVVGLTGRSGGRLRELSDHWIASPSDHTPRIQEAHLVVEHLLCEIVEESVREAGR